MTCHSQHAAVDAPQPPSAAPWSWPTGSTAAATGVRTAATTAATAETTGVTTAGCAAAADRTGHPAATTA